MPILEYDNYSDRPDIADAIATLIENLPEGPGVGFYTGRIEPSEQTCLVLVALDPHDIAMIVEVLGITEEDDEPAF